MKSKYKLHPFFEDPSPVIQSCEYSDCLKEGLYKAPRSLKNLRDYVWFCLDHVRHYNKNWNYFSGMSEREIERSWYGIFTWERPTRPFGTGPFMDPLNILGRFKANLEKEDIKFTSKNTPQKKLTDEENRALQTMGLSFTYTLKDLRNRYKQLVKTHHPDANGGCACCEEKLKVINRAYELLKKI